MMPTNSSLFPSPELLLYNPADVMQEVHNHSSITRHWPYNNFVILEQENKYVLIHFYSTTPDHNSESILYASHCLILWCDN